MTSKTLYLHIGHLKSGSSSIQNFLWDNRQELINANYKYIETGIAKERFIGIRHYHLGNSIGSSKCIWPLVIEEINNSKEKNFIISYEGLIRLTPDEIIKIKQILKNINVKIVCYLRRQDEFIQSFYAEYIQNQGAGDSFENFLKQYEWLCNYHSLISNWINIFGIKNVIVKNYDDVIRRKSSLEKDFTKAINLQLPEYLFESRSRSNATMCLEQLQKMFVLNHQETSSRIRRKYAKKLLTESPKESRKGLFFSSGNIELFMKDFQKGNKWLSERFNSFEGEFNTRYNYPELADSFQLESEDHTQIENSKLLKLKKTVKKIPYVSIVYRFIFKGLMTIRNKFPRSYKNWIKISENFNANYQFNKTLNIGVVINSAKSSNQCLELMLESLLNQKYSPSKIVVVLHYNQKLSERFLKNQNIRIIKNLKEILTLDLDWVIFVNHGMIFHHYALWEFAIVIYENKNIKFVYSDHDQFNEKGTRQNPHFKPDWNQDLFYEQEYIQGCGLFKLNAISDLVQHMDIKSRGNFYELVLFIQKKYSIDSISHISKVLFHFYESPEPITVQLTLKAIQTYINPKITVKSSDVGVKLEWPLSVEHPFVSLIIPTRNHLKILNQAVQSILEKTSYKNYEIIIVDNQSDDRNTKDYFKNVVKQNNNVRVIEYDKPFNYSAINNFAVNHAKGEIVGFINNDIEVISSDWLIEMVRQSVREDIGCVGAKLYYPNDTIQHAGVIVGLWGCAGHSHKGFARIADGYCYRLKSVQNYSAVTAACLVMDKQIFIEVGGFNEKDLSVAFNDIDLCLKVKQAGFNNLWTPYAELYHHESHSRGKDKSSEQIKRINHEINYMRITWQTHLKIDPCYNINLANNLEDFSLTRL